MSNKTLSKLQDRQESLIDEIKDTKGHLKYLRETKKAVDTQILIVKKQYSESEEYENSAAEDYLDYLHDQW